MNLKAEQLSGQSGWAAAEALVSLSLIVILFAESAVQHRRTSEILKQNYARIDLLSELRGLTSASPGLAAITSEQLSIGCSPLPPDDSPLPLNNCIIRLKTGAGPEFIKRGQPVIEDRQIL